MAPLPPPSPTLPMELDFCNFFLRGEGIGEEKVAQQLRCHVASRSLKSRPTVENTEVVSDWGHKRATRLQCWPYIEPPFYHVSTRGLSGSPTTGRKRKRETRSVQLLVL